MITITVSGDTPEVIAAHTTWLAQKLGGIDLIKEVRAKQTAEKAIEKAIEKAANTSKPEPTQDESPSDTATPAQVNAADKAEVQRLAQGKSKTAGAEAVKNCIAQFGGKTINTTPAEKLAELRAALEALT